MVEIVIGLGSNLGEPAQQLREAVRRLRQVAKLEVLRGSKIYDTDPIGPPQPRYLNAAVCVAWPDGPLALLQHTRAIEQAMGRTREVHWGPRTIDLDLLWSSAGALQTQGLQLPHPRLHERSFALAPLIDVMPALHDVYGAQLALLGGPPRVTGNLV